LPPTWFELEPPEAGPSSVFALSAEQPALQIEKSASIQDRVAIISPSRRSFRTSA
jgi:hypothetical protein